MSMPLQMNNNYEEKEAKDDEIEILSEVPQEIKEKTISIISSGSQNNRIGI